MLSQGDWREAISKPTMVLMDLSQNLAAYVDLNHSAAIVVNVEGLDSNFYYTHNYVSGFEFC